jgi:hypothetical protein
LIAGDGCGKRTGSDISKEPYRIPGQSFQGWIWSRIWR